MFPLPSSVNPVEELCKMQRLLNQIQQQSAAASLQPTTATALVSPLKEKKVVKISFVDPSPVTSSTNGDLGKINDSQGFKRRISLPVEEEEPPTKKAKTSQPSTKTRHDILTELCDTYQDSQGKNNFYYGYNNKEYIDQDGTIYQEATISHFYKISDASANPTIPKPDCLIRDLQTAMQQQQSKIAYKMVSFADVLPLEKKRKVLMRAVELDMEKRESEKEEWKEGEWFGGRDA